MRTEVSAVTTFVLSKRAVTCAVYLPCGRPAGSLMNKSVSESPFVASCCARTMSTICLLLVSSWATSTTVLSVSDVIDATMSRFWPGTGVPATLTSRTNGGPDDGQSQIAKNMSTMRRAAPPMTSDSLDCAFFTIFFRC